MNHEKRRQDGQQDNKSAEKPKLMTIHSIGKGFKAGAGQIMFRTGGSLRGPREMFHRSPGNDPLRKQ